MLRRRAELGMGSRMDLSFAFRTPMENPNTRDPVFEIQYAEHLPAVVRDGVLVDSRYLRTFERSPTMRYDDIDTDGETILFYRDVGACGKNGGTRTARTRSRAPAQ